MLNFASNVLYKVQKKKKVAHNIETQLFSVWTLEAIICIKNTIIYEKRLGRT